MKFEYETEVDDREVVAFTFLLDGKEGELGLCVKGEGNKCAWLYHDGYVLCSGNFMAELQDGKHITKKFYKGDKITITF
jgi:hypothetical protein